MMARLLTIVLALSILCSGTGWAMRVHYCMGQKTGASLAALPEDDACRGCGMKRAAGAGCCRDEHVVVKDQSDIILEQTATHEPFATLPVLPAVFIAWLSDRAFAAPERAYPSRPHGPPRIEEQPLYLRHCVFRI